MYCTLTDITALIPEQTVINLTDDSGIGVIEQASVDAAISDADAEIDSYCAGRYLVPFGSALGTTVPAVIVKVSVDVAIYNLYSRCAEKIPESREARYKNAIALLKEIAKGVVTLGQVPAPEANPQGSNRPETVSSPRLFTRESLRGM